MNSKLLLVAVLFTSAQVMAQEQESDFSQPAQSETVVEEYGPAHSALIEPKNDIDSEVKESAANANDDFSHSVPEPHVAKSRLAGLSHSKKQKTTKHVAQVKKHKKSHTVAKAKAKKHAKPSRSIASVKSKKHSKNKTLAKRGNSQSTLR